MTDEADRIIEPFAINALRRIAIALGMGEGNWQTSEVAEKAIEVISAKKPPEPSKLHVYHYHAQRQIGDSTFLHVDGVIQTTLPVDSMPRYEEIKTALAAQFFDDAPSDQLIIESFTRL